MNNERNYNFRQANKIKEQKRRALIYEFGYFPTMSKKSEGNKGKSYYVECCKDNYKQSLKKIAAKKLDKAILMNLEMEAIIKNYLFCHGTGIKKEGL